jgi:hypothetical protein
MCVSKILFTDWKIKYVHGFELIVQGLSNVQPSRKKSMGLEKSMFTDSKKEVHRFN